jgi:hypothetical protein
MLVDFAVEEIGRGTPRTQALVEAGRNRARPIVMTTIAMAGGMFPSAISAGSHGAYSVASSAKRMTNLRYPCTGRLRPRSGRRRRMTANVDRLAIARPVLQFELALVAGQHDVGGFIQQGPPTLEPGPPLKGMETLIATHFFNDIRKERPFRDGAANEST